jgi:site-specific recombinase XerD
LIMAFLDELEQQRGISPRSRNLRLSAIRSFFRYVSFESPMHAAQIQRVLAIPPKRYPRKLVSFLSRQEAEPLLRAPQPENVGWSAGSYVDVVMGKGRKERCTPLAKRAVAVMREWLKEPPLGNEGLLFTNARAGD